MAYEAAKQGLQIGLSDEKVLIMATSSCLPRLRAKLERDLQKADELAIAIRAGLDEVARNV